MTYEDLVHLEKEAAQTVRRLEDAERLIDDECCAQHGLTDVEAALATARRLHAKIAGAMLDTLRAETRVA